MSELGAIIARRAAIRLHRDQKGDDRCWIDDFYLSPPSPRTLPSYDEGMRLCAEFHRHRNAAAADPLPPDAIADAARWNDDLKYMTPAQLAAERARIEAAVALWDSKTPRTAHDDRALYAVLPEKLPADFRLPPAAEFLGEAKAPHAGCPSFWRSHAECAGKLHNIHRWGPCGKK